MRSACSNGQGWLSVGLAFALTAAAALADEPSSARTSETREGARNASQAPAAQNADAVLVWDTTERVIEPKPGDGAAEFQFTVVNVSDKPVTILQIRPTCGCPIAEMPASPWVIAPGASGTFVGTIDFRGKEGTVTKAIFVNSSVGTQRLGLTVKIPTLDAAARREAQMIAQKNRQAVFAGECAKCHLEPAKGKLGAELFMSACGVCHFSPNRSSIVPDLLVARQHRDAEFWRTWIAQGKDGTLMPAWSRKQGGPLSDAQIDSLVKYAMETLPTEPPSKG